MRKPFGQNQTVTRAESPVARARRLGQVSDAMADVIRERVAAGGCCTADDLAIAGFTAAEVIEHIEDARKLVLGLSEREAA